MKPLHFVGNSKTQLKGFPHQVRERMGYALYEAQLGHKAANVKPLKGFGGAGVLEVLEAHDGSTYRAVYTVKFADTIYVLHCFQKKSKKGIATPKQEIDLIQSRLKWAEADWRKEKKS